MKKTTFPFPTAQVTKKKKIPTIAGKEPVRRPEKSQACGACAGIKQADTQLPNILANLTKIKKKKQKTKNSR